MMTIEKRNPDTITPPIGHYSHVAVVPPGFVLLTFAGQVGGAPDGTYPDSIEAQFENALSTAMALAATQGAGRDDLVKATYYLTERPQDFARIRAAIVGAFGDTPPAATYLIVNGLAREEMKVEIELVAAVPEDVFRK